MRSVILEINPATYVQHALHTGERDWAETNCYTDVWIELLHGLGHEPLAALPFTFEIDFEGDQWTFFKFPISDLFDLFGLDIQELNIWESLAGQIQEQVRTGRPVLAEMDSFYLPDTAGTAYQIGHVKTTVAVVDIDVDAHRMGYFHGQSFYQVSGEDFNRLFHLDPTQSEPGWLPPYVELVKLNRGPSLAGDALVARARELLKMRVGRRPTVNPVRAFRERFQEDLVWLKERPLDYFHQYSFATLRQAGACFELAANHLGWLIENGHEEFGTPSGHFQGLSSGSKSLQFKLARVIGRKKEIDLEPLLDELESHWENGMASLTRVL